MKKKKIILLLILTFLTLMTSMNVKAASCSSYKKSAKCNSHSKCMWYNNKCWKLQTAAKKCTKACNEKADGSSSSIVACTNSCTKSGSTILENKTKCYSNCKKNYKNNSAALTSCNTKCEQDANSELKKSLSKNAKSSVNFCASTAKIWKIIGILFTALKILIPIIMIIFGSLDLARAIFDSNDGIIKASKRLMIRILSAIIIFLLPSIVTLVIGLFVGFSDDGVKNDYEYCRTCITNPNDCETVNDASNQK